MTTPRRGKSEPLPIDDTLRRLLDRLGVVEASLWNRIRDEWVELSPTSGAGSGAITVVVDANAFQYLPQTEVLRVYTRLVIEVADNGPGTVNVLERNRPFQAVDPQFDALYADHFLNYPSGRYTTVAEDGGLLIISHDSFAASMQGFLEWKLQKGLDARLATLTGRDEDNIRRARQNLGVSAVRA